VIPKARDPPLLAGRFLSASHTANEFTAPTKMIRFDLACRSTNDRCSTALPIFQISHLSLNLKMNLLAAFDSAVRTTPDKPFIRFEGLSISYREMKRRSQIAAGVLAANGVGPGDTVALMCFNTPAFVEALLGAWRLAATVVPVNHKLKAPEVEYILRHSGSKVLLFDASLVNAISGMDGWITTLSTGGSTSSRDFDGLMRETSAISGIEPNDEAIAEILYTSGTTGKPKGCILTHRSVAFAAITMALAVSITRDARTLIAMPIWHSSPLNNWFGGTVYVGGTVILLREFEPRQLLATVQSEKVTCYFGAPISYAAPLELEDFDSFDLSSVRAWIYGGGPISVAAARRFTARYRSNNFYQVYGMTETGPAGTVLYPDEQFAHAGSIGRTAMPGVDIRLIRENGADAIRGESGELWMRADSTMLGYLNDDAATNNAFADSDWYRTGDLARLDNDGYLFIVDRLKDMIITGGENVYSKEVEDALTEHPSIADAAVFAVPHEIWGETVAADIVMKCSMTLTPDDIRHYLESRLARYKIPRLVYFSEQLPRTPTGKIQKFALREMHSNDRFNATSHGDG
jgi:feruloyl-CoA synthase